MESFLLKDWFVKMQPFAPFYHVVFNKQRDKRAQNPAL
jgi:hypothetical protein